MCRFSKVAPAPSKGNGEECQDGISPASSPASSIKLERIESLLSRNLAIKVSFAVVTAFPMDETLEPLTDRESCCVLLLGHEKADEPCAVVTRLVGASRTIARERFCEMRVEGSPAFQRTSRACYGGYFAALWQFVMDSRPPQAQLQSRQQRGQH